MLLKKHENCSKDLVGLGVTYVRSALFESPSASTWHQQFSDNLWLGRVGLGVGRPIIGSEREELLSRWERLKNRGIISCFSSSASFCINYCILLYYLEDGSPCWIWSCIDLWFINVASLKHLDWRSGRIYGIIWQLLWLLIFAISYLLWLRSRSRLVLVNRVLSWEGLLRVWEDEEWGSTEHHLFPASTSLDCVNCINWH